uniref:Uncharacterized protein n=1 Tax=Leersia perrieri TaxID=77586 RepID=A0A0D9Y0Y6_9ORYZ
MAGRSGSPGELDYRAALLSRQTTMQRRWQDSRSSDDESRTSSPPDPRPVPSPRAALKAVPRLNPPAPTSPCLEACCVAFDGFATMLVVSFSAPPGFASPPPCLTHPKRLSAITFLRPAYHDMRAKESRLQLALVALVIGDRQDVSPKEAHQALVRQCGLHGNSFSVRHFAPENLFDNMDDRARLLGQGQIPLIGYKLLGKPWSSLAHAAGGKLWYRVRLHLEGVPAHLATAAAILGPSCDKLILLLRQCPAPSAAAPPCAGDRHLLP